MRSDRKDRLSNCCKIEFLDFNFHKPDFAAHLEAVKQVRPKYAVAPDLFAPEQLTEVLGQAAKLAEYAERVIIVPKYNGAIASIPLEYVIGLSVPTKYGNSGTVMLIELWGRKVHLLGGSPHQQLRLYQALAGAEVVSIDGNMLMLAAKYGDFWDAGKRGWNRTMRDAGMPYEKLIQMSINNIVQFWRRMQS